MKANIDDCKLIYKMQIESFKELLGKYKDIDTNPGAESFESVLSRYNQKHTTYYIICKNELFIGAIRVVTLNNETYRISPIFILPQHQGNGYSQIAIKELESMYPQAKKQCLDTIKEESKLCYLYEKIGYTKTGKEEKLLQNMTICYYEKKIK